ncbi:MAG: conjugal transfer protein TraX [Oscillospiraceae bacterium]|nr:conjugal transfer protein TraX [Oscillospiraceae bacterium]
MLKLDAYKLKWIAIIGMILSHTVYAWWEYMPMGLQLPLSALGGFTFPIMAFFVVEGYRHTSNLKKYILRLLIFAVIATPFHFLVIAVPGLNILFTIILSLLVLAMYDSIKKRAIFWVLYIIVIVPISLLFFEFFFLGVTMVLLYHIIKKESVRRVLPPIAFGVSLLTMSVFGLLFLPSNPMPAEGFYALFRNATWINSADYMKNAIVFSVVCLLVAILIKNYNGERGKRMKWLFYIMYPLHFAVFAAISLALGLW